MPFLAAALAMAALHAPPAARQPIIFMAVLPETASGFATLADCEKALGAPRHGTAHAWARRGSLFNLTAGNISRCEIVDGEAVMAVIPRPFAK